MLFGTVDQVAEQIEGLESVALTSRRSGTILLSERRKIGGSGLPPRGEEEVTGSC